MPQARHCLRAVTEQTLFIVKVREDHYDSDDLGKVNETRAVEGHQGVVGAVNVGSVGGLVSRSATAPPFARKTARDLYQVGLSSCSSIPSGAAGQRGV